MVMLAADVDTPRSAFTLTRGVSVALFRLGPGSVGSLDVETVLLRVVPLGVPELTLTTKVRVRVPVGAVAPLHVQLTVTVPVQRPPELGVEDTQVVPAGRVSEMFTACASEGPLFVTMIV